MDEREKKKVCSAFMFVADPISCSLILAATKVPQIHISTVPQFRPKLTLHIDLHYFDVQKEYTHNQRKKHMCTAFPHLALILVATILAQIEVDLDQSWQSSTSFVST